MGYMLTVNKAERPNFSGIVLRPVCQSTVSVLSWYSHVLCVQTLPAFKRILNHSNLCLQSFLQLGNGSSTVLGWLTSLITAGGVINFVSSSTA